MRRRSRGGRRGSRRLSGRTPAAIAVALGIGILIGPAGAQTTRAAELALTPDTVEAGGTTRAEGRDFTPRTAVRLHLDEVTDATLLAQTEASEDGGFATMLTIPDTTPPGEHDVLACEVVRTTCRTVARAQLTVRPRATPPPAQEPPEGARPTPASTTTPRPLTVPTTTPTTAGPGLAGPPTPSQPAAGDLAQTGDLPDLFVTGVEITQGIQNLANHMPLVAGRTTVARVYLQTDGGGMVNVNGALKVTPPGGPDVVVYPFNGPVAADEDGSDRLDSDATLNFLLPPQATVSTDGGKTDVLAYVWDGVPSAPALHEPAAANNYGEASVAFHEVPALAVRMFPVHVHDPWPGGQEVTFEPTSSLQELFNTSKVWAAAYRYIPIHSLVFLPGPALYPQFHGTHGSPHGVPDCGSYSSDAVAICMAAVQAGFYEWDLTDADLSHMGNVNAVLKDHWEQDTPADDFEQFYGAVSHQYPKPDPPGLSNATVASGWMDTSVMAEAPWYQEIGGKTLAHELAHNVGFKHNLCAGNEWDGGPVEFYPWSGPPCTLADVDPAGFYGFDVAWQGFSNLAEPTVISNNPNQAHPNRGFPVMGYQGPRWIDPQYWCRQLDHFGVPCQAVPVPTPLTPTPLGLQLTPKTSDLEHVDVAFVGLPSEIQVGTSEPFAVRHLVANNGPAMQSNARLRVFVAVSSGCQVQPSGWILQDLPGFAEGAQKIVDTPVTVTCSEVGSKVTEVDARIEHADPNGQDPDPENDQSLAGVSFDVVEPEPQIQAPVAQPTPTPPPMQGVTSPYKTVATQKGWLRVDARLHDEGATIVDMRRVPDPLPHVLPELERLRGLGEPAGAQVRIVDATGATLASLPLVLTESGDGLLPKVRRVVDYLPWLGRPSAVEIVRDGRVLDRHGFSARPPRIEVTAPSGGRLRAPVAVRWRASDPDRDELRFTVSYSPDGGETWTLLARDVSGNRYTVESFDVVPGGKRAQFRVEATDGVHTASDTTEPAVVADGPPVLHIASPAHGAVVRLNAPVELRASAFDWEDGMARPADVRWASDRDGELSTGAVAFTDSLSAGKHRITATAFDSSGNATDRSIAIFVDGSRPLPRPVGEELAAMRAALRISPSDPPWIPIGVAALVLVAAGWFFVRARRARTR